MLQITIISILSIVLIILARIVFYRIKKNNAQSMQNQKLSKDAYKPIISSKVDPKDEKTKATGTKKNDLDIGSGYPLRKPVHG